MYQGKTKRGVELRETMGMRKNDERPIWALVIDRSRMRLFVREQNPEGTLFRLRQEIVNPEGRMKGHELVSDHPGRVFESRDQSHRGQAGGTRHSYGSSFAPENNVVDLFTKQVAEALRALVPEKGCALKVFAEPAMTGVLKPLVEKMLPECETEYIERDYAWVDNRDLVNRLKELIR